jgi:amino-acid N-acetyltransferase
MQTDDERTPPNRIRLTGLQEGQLAALVELDAACSAMYYDAGFDGAEVPLRSQADFAAIGRSNSCKVAEADHVVAGFLAWHDEAPGVAYLVDIQVHPEYQRFGIASSLMEAMRDEARHHKLEQIVVRCWEKASWAMTFYKRQRFQPIDATAPAKVQAWKEDQLAGGKPLTRPGEVVLWSPIGPPTKLLTDDEMDMTLVTGELPHLDD